MCRQYPDVATVGGGLWTGPGDALRSVLGSVEIEQITYGARTDMNEIHAEGGVIAVHFAGDIETSTSTTPPLTITDE